MDSLASSLQDLADPSPADSRQAQLELIECLQKLGRIMLASNNSVGMVKSTLQDIADVYHMKSQIVALPNILIVKLGESQSATLDISTDLPGALRLNQASDLAILIDDLYRRRITPSQASSGIDRIMQKPPRFNQWIILLGYVISVIGLTLRLQPQVQIIFLTGALGLLVGLIQAGVQRFPRYQVLAPAIAALVVSIPTFYLAKTGFLYAPVNLVIPPLVTFLPGAMLTTAMIELASANLISGSSRLIYGFTVLLLLYVGIATAAQITGWNSVKVEEFAAQDILLWQALLGTALFGIGNFIHSSGRNKDLFWILVVLYAAMAGQLIGETFFNDYFGAFLGALVLAVSSELIALSPKRTPAIVSQTLAFWFLVPGSRALLSVTTLLDAQYATGNFGLNEVILLIVSVSLGILLGTILVSSIYRPKDRRRIWM